MIFSKEEEQSWLGSASERSSPYHYAAFWGIFWDPGCGCCSMGFYVLSNRFPV